MPTYPRVLDQAKTVDPTSTYAKFSLARFGRVGVFAGDSITAGTGASGATTSAYVAMVPKITGNALVSAASTNSGVAGNTSALLLARMPTILAASPDFVHVQIGTNDAGASVSLATFQANIIAIKALCDAAGAPITIGTVPPRTVAQGATIAGFVRSYNLWLRLWASRAGVKLIPTGAALVDNTTGYMSASYDSGDGTHPNDAGHLAMAGAIATALSSALPAQPWFVTTAGAGLATDPLATTTPGGWELGSGVVASLVAASGGDLPYGGWKRFTATNATGSPVLKNFDMAFTTGFTAGDVLLLAAYFRASSLTAINKIQYQNQALTVRNVLFQSPPSATPGPILKTFTVQGGDTTVYINFLTSVPANDSTTFDVGACDVFNLTTLGLASTAV